MFVFTGIGIVVVGTVTLTFLYMVFHRVRRFLRELIGDIRAAARLSNDMVRIINTLDRITNEVNALREQQKDSCASPSQNVTSYPQDVG